MVQADRLIPVSFRPYLRNQSLAHPARDQSDDVRIVKKWREVMQAVLEGLRVIDLSSVLLGPYCTMGLADMGAEVIKVEPPEGDMMRQTGQPAKTVGMGPIHMTINRGKRSVVLDLKTAHDRAIMYDLLSTADVFIHNIRRKAIQRLELDYDVVRRLNPKIVYVHCVGFGSDGPYADFPAYDDVIQALSGLTTLISRVDGNPAPRYLPSAIADKVTGLHALYGTLAALFNRERTGEGRMVEVPMLEAVTAFTMAEHLFGQTFLPPNAPVGFHSMFEKFKQPFRTADGYLSIVVYVEDQAATFFKRCERMDVLDDPRFSIAEARTRNMSALLEKMAEITPTRSTADWCALLAESGMPTMPVTDLSNVIDDPHLTATRFFRDRVHPTEGAYREMAQPVRFSGIVDTPSRPPAHLGEHTDEVLLELKKRTPA